MTDRMLTSRKVPNPCGPEMPRLLARIFSTLLEAGEDNRDAAVENGLKSLGEFLRVEELYFSFQAGGRRKAHGQYP